MSADFRRKSAYLAAGSKIRFGGTFVSDVVFVLLTVAVFVLLGLVVKGVERL
ncbi:hypothetical protein [Spirillospora sp. CA-128828]|uniref:hypothetical protein n=1 Tax=Spirillospora sp. CA-128828 TaxID=3240033 RepID=UPI003D8C930A